MSCLISGGVGCSQRAHGAKARQAHVHARHDQSVNLRGCARLACGRLDAINCNPVVAAGQFVIKMRGGGKVLQIAFVQVAGAFTGAAHEHACLRFVGLDAEIKDDIFDGKAARTVFDLAEPFEKDAAVGGGGARSLMREVGGDVAVGEHSFSFVERADHSWLLAKAVSGKEHGGESGVDLIERAEFAGEVAFDQPAKVAFVGGEADGLAGKVALGEFVGEEFDLSALPSAVDSFEDYKHTARHGGGSLSFQVDSDKGKARGQEGADRGYRSVLVC